MFCPSIGLNIQSLSRPPAFANVNRMMALLIRVGSREGEESAQATGPECKSSRTGHFKFAAAISIHFATWEKPRIIFSPFNTIRSLIFQCE